MPSMCMLVLFMFMIRVLMFVLRDPDFMGMTRVRIFGVRLGMVMDMGVWM